MPVRINPRQRVIKALFKTYVDVVYIKKTDAKRMGVDTSTRMGDDRRGVVGVGGEDDAAGGGGEDEDDEMDLEGGVVDKEASAQARIKERMTEMSRRDDIYEYLARSLAPSIWEMDDVKKGILLQLFGGTNKSISSGGGGGGPRYRGDINVLMVGDPGTSKSQILQVRCSSPPFFFRATWDFKKTDAFFSNRDSLVRSQDCASWSLHLWKGIFRCRSYRLRHS